MASNKKEIISHRLQILKALILKKRPRNKRGIPYEFYLTKICESGGRSLENSVALIYESNIIEEFLTRNNYILT